MVHIGTLHKLREITIDETSKDCFPNYEKYRKVYINILIAEKHHVWVALILQYIISLETQFVTDGLPI